MRSGVLGHMANLPTNGVNGHLPGDALAAGRLPGTPSLDCLVCQLKTPLLRCLPPRCADAALPLAVVGAVGGHAAAAPRRRLWFGAARAQQGERGRRGGHVHGLLQQQQRLGLKDLCVRAFVVFLIIFVNKTLESKCVFLQVCFLMM